MNYKTFDLLSQFPECVHGFTYRNGGIAQLPYGNQHMGVLSFHHREEAWLNIKNLVSELGLNDNINGLVLTEQIHSDHLTEFVATNETPEMRDGYPVYVQHGTDGIFTREKNVLLMTFYADCTPVFFLDKNCKAIGMVHSGWKGTALKIAASGAKFMQTHFDSRLSDLSIVIGPAAGSCCYEVDQLVFDAFPGHADCFVSTRPGHFHMDLRKVIKKDLIALGILESQIEVSSDCTMCQNELYFSHRKELGDTGRMTAFMFLK